MHIILIVEIWFHTISLTAAPSVSLVLIFCVLRNTTLFQLCMWRGLRSVMTSRHLHHINTETQTQYTFCTPLWQTLDFILMTLNCTFPPRVLYGFWMSSSHLLTINREEKCLHPLLWRHQIRVTTRHLWLWFVCFLLLIHLWIQHCRGVSLGLTSASPAILLAAVNHTLREIPWRNRPFLWSYTSGIRCHYVYTVMLAWTS